MRATNSGGQPSNGPFLSPFFLHLASFSPLALRALSLIHGALLVDGFARESYEYMYARPWSRVVDFYAELVRAGAGAAGLAKLFGNDEVGTNIFFLEYVGELPINNMEKLFF
jgi:hypothetical protein